MQLNKVHNVSVTYGEQKNENRSTTVEQQTAASQVIGLGTVTLATTGNKDESHIDITGSDVIGANKTKLHTEGNINLTAADEQTSNRSNVGGFGMGQSSSNNTELYAGKDLIQTGAGVYGNKIDVDVENLIQKSLQDTEVSNSKQLNVNAQGTFGYGFSVSGGVSGSKSKGDYAAVNEQAGIFAGDGGYDVNVRNHTDQTGAIITSTAKAEQQGLNSFTTGTYSKKDIENHADYDAKSLSIGGGIAKNGTGENKHHLTEQNSGSKDASLSKSMGFGSDSGHETSTTKSGVSTANMKITNAKAQQQLTGKTTEQTIADAKTKLTTEDIFNGANGNLKNNYDKDTVQQEVDLQAQVSKETDENRQFVKQKLYDIAKNKYKEAETIRKANGGFDNEESKKLEAQADKIEKATMYADGALAGVWGAGGGTAVLGEKFVELNADLAKEAAIHPTSGQLWKIQCGQGNTDHCYDEKTGEFTSAGTKQQIFNLDELKGKDKITISNPGIWNPNNGKHSINPMVYG